MAANKTPLHAEHKKLSAHLVNFFNWEMPLHYGSQLKEHLCVRQNSGIFDVSHMGIIDVSGTDCVDFLRHLLAGDIAKLGINKGLYCCMLNPQGGVKDDLIIYRLSDIDFRLVINCSNKAKNLAWLEQHKKKQNITIKLRQDLAIIAIQGPKTAEMIPTIFPHKNSANIASLKSFTLSLENDWLIARTGYTGEDGFEIILPATEASIFWNDLITANIQPCGLGARDTLRLEAGLNLYGADMDENISPLESGLAWTIDLTDTHRNFIGKNALINKKNQGVNEKRAGIVVNRRIVIRKTAKIQTEFGSGIITSGGYSPTLNLGIALARVPANANNNCTINIRNQQQIAQIIRPPFIRHGKPTFVENSQ